MNASNAIAAKSSRPWWRSTAFQVVVSVAVVALVFGFLFPQLADYGAAWDSVRAMSWPWVVALSVVALCNLASYLPLLVTVLPGMRLREAAVSNLASTAVSNTLPGGGALGVGVTVTIQRSYGIPATDIALGAVVSGVWNNFSKLGLPVIALALMAITGRAGAGLVSASLVGVAVLALLVALFAVLLRSETLARRVGSGAQRVASALVGVVRRDVVSGWGEGAVRFRERTVRLVTGRALRITVATVVSHASLYLVLLVALRAVGVTEAQAGWIEALAAFAFVRLLSAVPVTPGGLGVVELGLTASLGAGLPDPVQNRVAAAVLVYRALTWFAPIPIGVAAWTFWRSNRSWRRTVDERSSERARAAA